MLYIEGTFKLTDKVSNGHTTSGNPKFILSLGGRVVHTKPNAGYSYALGNYVGKWCKVAMKEDKRGRMVLLTIEEGEAPDTMTIPRIKESGLFNVPDSVDTLTHWVEKHDGDTRARLFTLWGMLCNYIVGQEIGGGAR